MGKAKSNEDSVFWLTIYSISEIVRYFLLLAVVISAICNFAVYKHNLRESANGINEVYAANNSLFGLFFDVTIIGAIYLALPKRKD